MPRVYQVIAKALQARINCERSGNTVWHPIHSDKILQMVNDHLPRGSGFDSGTQFNFIRSTPEKLVFETSFHHMDEGGSYCGWSEHQVIVTPSLVFDFDVRVTGRNVRNIKEYISETFNSALDELLEGEY